MGKTLYIIAGCNGAGKTTTAYTLLPEMYKCKEFVNSDEIARGLSPFRTGEHHQAEISCRNQQFLQNVYEESRLLVYYRQH